jgi:hypothetical protein
MRIKVWATLRMATSGGRLRSSSDPSCELQRHLDDVEPPTSRTRLRRRQLTVPRYMTPEVLGATGGTPITGAQAAALQVPAH